MAPYPSPVPGGTYEGIDQGIDFSAPDGAYARAIAPGWVSKVSPRGSWAGGTGAAVYETLAQPILAGLRTYPQVYYAEEDPAPGVGKGSVLSTGDPVLVFSAEQSEIGFASGNEPAAPRPPPRPANQWTQAGADFAGVTGFGVPTTPGATRPKAGSGIGAGSGASTPSTSTAGIGGGGDPCKALCIVCDLVPSKILGVPNPAKVTVCGGCWACRALPGTPGGPPNPAGAVSSILQLPDFLGKISDPSFWLRVLELVGGGVLLLMGVYLLARSVGGGSTPAAAAARLVPGVK